MVKKTVPSADKSFDNGNIVSPTTQLELKNPPIVNGFTPVYQLKTFSAANFLSPCKDTQNLTRTNLPIVVLRPVLSYQIYLHL